MSVFIPYLDVTPLLSDSWPAIIAQADSRELKLIESLVGEYVVGANLKDISIALQARWRVLGLSANTDLVQRLESSHESGKELMAKHADPTMLVSQLREAADGIEGLSAKLAREDAGQSGELSLDYLLLSQAKFAIECYLATHCKEKL